MGYWDDWLNGRKPRNFDPAKNARPEYYEDTHDESGRYTGRAEPKSLPNQSESVAMRQYQNVVVYKPKNYSDVQQLLDYLKRREPAIINLDQTDLKYAQRVLDFVAGAIYALSGSIHRIATNIFLLSPEGVEIMIPYDM